MAADEAKGLFDPEKLRVLIPTAGGPNALIATGLGMRVAKRSAHPLTVLYVERVSGLFDRIFRPFQNSVEGKNLAEHLDQMSDIANDIGVAAPEIRRQSSRDVVRTIGNESMKGYDLVMVGASGVRRGMRGEKLEKLVADAPCHVAIVKHGGVGTGPYRRVLVPVDGSFVSRVAIEFAIRYAEGVGDGAEVVIAVVADRDRSHISLPPPALVATPHRSGTTVPQARANSLLLVVDSLAKDGGLEKLSPVFKATKVKTRIIVRSPSDGGPHRLPVLAEANSGKYDLVVIGAENRAIHHRLFFGYDNERLVEESRITVVLIVPKVQAA